MYHFELKPFRSQWAGPAQFEKEVEKIFDVFSKAHTFAPACEILEEEKFFSISLDIPGLRKEELDIEVKDDHLHISGERKQESRPESSHILKSERRYGKFTRVFTLPQNVKADAIEARFENGVLEINLPKEEKSTSKKIQISGRKNEDVLPELKN